MSISKEQAVKHLDNAIAEVRKVFMGYEPKSDFEFGWAQGISGHLIDQLTSLANEIKKHS